MIKIDAASLVKSTTMNTNSPKSKKEFKTVIAKTLNADQFTNGAKKEDSIQKYCSGGII